MSNESTKLIDFLKSGPCPLCGKINCPHIDAPPFQKNLNQMQELIDKGDAAKIKQRWMQLWGMRRKAPESFDHLKSPNAVTLPTIKVKAQPDKKPISPPILPHIVINSVPAPDGLKVVAYYSLAINEAGKKYDVDPLAIGSIVFQEKFFSVAATIKNYAAYISDLGKAKESSSYGLGEMQLGLAADLLDYPATDKNRLEKAFDLITSNPQIALDLVAKNISNKQKSLGRHLTPREAAIFHNSGDVGLDSYLDPTENKSKFDLPEKVYNRSRNWQNSIKAALNGIIDSKPDNKSDFKSNPYRPPLYWKPGMKYKGL